MNVATPKLEFSTDPLSVSNASAAWKDVTMYCKEMSWQSGVSREFDDPQAGTATFILKNLQRRFEPEYAAGAYYPNIVPGRRFRITITADGVNYTQGIWYAQRWDVQYPDRGNPYSEVVVTCTDGFWRLALDPQPLLSPVAATSYTEVVASDNPIAHFPLNETSGAKFSGDPGPDGSFKNGAMYFAQTNPVLGEADTAALVPAGIYGKAAADDKDVFKDAGQFTIECVANITATDTILAAFGFVTSLGSFQFELWSRNLIVSTNNTGISNPSVPGTYHFCGTWDGTTLTFYRNGVVTGATGSASSLDNSDASENFYIHGGHGTFLRDVTISHVAFYTTALSPVRVAAHATAALSRGYAAATSGTRIATLATDPLWSTAGIPAGTITAMPRMQFGQSTIDEIALTAKIEQPGSLFYFDDSGNPDYRALQDTQTVAAVFGDAPGEIQYDDIQLVYNDELFNQSTVSGEGLDGRTVSNSASISDYGVRSQDATGLIITNNPDAGLIAQTIIDRFATPAFRCDSITLNGSTQAVRTQILTREIGDTIRIRRRGDGGTPIDVITRILQKSKSLDVNGDLRCTWTLARGFNAATTQWHLGVAGFSELGQTTVLA